MDDADVQELRRVLRRYLGAAVPLNAVNGEDAIKAVKAAYRAGKRAALAAAPTPPEQADARDAARYRWLRDQHKLTLISSGNAWTREDGSTYVSSHYLAAGGTRYAELPTLDETIDAAMGDPK